MLVKFSTRAILCALFTSAFLTSAWAMEPLPDDVIKGIVRLNSKPYRLGMLIQSPLFKELCNYRLISKDWRRSTDRIIFEEKFLAIYLHPNNCHNESLKEMAPLTNTIDLIGWRHYEGEALETALSQHPFPHVTTIHYSPKTGAENYIGPDLGRCTPWTGQELGLFKLFFVPGL